MRILRTAGYHEVRAADKDGNHGSGGGEHWEQCWVLPESVYWSPIVDRPCSRRQRSRLTNDVGMRPAGAPVGISSSNDELEPFPTLNQSGSPSPDM